jgi:hypothetical protein
MHPTAQVRPAKECWFDEPSLVEMHAPEPQNVRESRMGGYSTGGVLTVGPEDDDEQLVHSVDYDNIAREAGDGSGQPVADAEVDHRPAPIGDLLDVRQLH